MILSQNNPHEMPPVRSTAQTFSAGNPLHFKGFVPARERGKRVVIDGVTVTISIADFNVATTAIQGEDLYRFIKRVRIEQIDGVTRYNLRGDELRAALYEQLGPDGVNEYADTSVANDQTAEIAIYIPFSKPFSYSPGDFAMPADVLKQITVECGDLSELGVSGGTVTVDSAEVYVIAHCHLDKSVIMYAVDSWESTEFQNTANVQLVPHGRLADLFVFKRGASGGTALTNLTSVRIDNPGIMPSELDRNPDLVEAFLRARGDTKTGTTLGAVRSPSPFANDKACPVLWHTARMRNFDPVLADVVDLKTTQASAISDLIAIHRTIQPRSQRLEGAVMRAYGLGAGAFRVKSRDKTKRAITAWPEVYRPYLPLSGPLNR